MAKIKAMLSKDKEMGCNFVWVVIVLSIEVNLNNKQYLFRLDIEVFVCWANTVLLEMIANAIISKVFIGAGS
jgi:hypothetical protein